VLYENESRGSKAKEVEIIVAVVDPFGNCHVTSTHGVSAAVEGL
jgi:hypothetical protein